MATHNLDRDSGSAKDGAIDYITWLDDDAVPSVVKRLDSLPPSKRSALRQWACETTASGRGWREWNLSASRADRAVGPICAGPLAP